MTGKFFLLLIAFSLNQSIAPESQAVTIAEKGTAKAVIVVAGDASEAHLHSRERRWLNFVSVFRSRSYR